ncbi:MAG: class I SAM-dependent methyltransferase [Planctomycetes bacterium]|nr:class I SAM-dependent methyltransferase [Planctomycetota bacterium]
MATPDKESERYSVPLTQRDWDGIVAELRRNPHFLMHLRGFRKMVAQRRAAAFGLEKSVDQVPETSISYTVDHNKNQANQFSEAHVNRLIAPLSIIDPLIDRKSEVSLLSIGPRNEMELFALYAVHFNPRKIKAIDLISNSPLIDIGDMHAIPYPDSSFEVVLCSWTLMYSNNHKLAASEMIRVCQDKGIIAVGVTRVPEGHPEHAQIVREGSIPYQSTAELIALFGDCVVEVPFRHEPTNPADKGALMAIMRIRKPAGQ